VKSVIPTRYSGYTTVSIGRQKKRMTNREAIKPPVLDEGEAEAALKAVCKHLHHSTIFLRVQIQRACVLTDMYS
jgi:hypothetical protein